MAGVTPVALLEPQDPLVGIERTVLDEVIRAGERREPLPIGIVVNASVPVGERDRSRRCISNGDAFREQPFHSLVRRERLSLLDADRCEEPERLGIIGIGSVAGAVVAVPLLAVSAGAFALATAS